MIRTSCSRCQAHLSYEDRYRDSLVSCPYCDNQIKLKALAPPRPPRSEEPRPPKRRSRNDRPPRRRNRRDAYNVWDLIPPELWDEAEELGEPEFLFGSKPLPIIPPIIAASVSGFLFLISIFVSAVLAILMLLALIGAGIWLAIALARNSNRPILFFEEGLIRLHGRDSLVIPWDDVLWFSFHIEEHQIHVYESDMDYYRGREAAEVHVEREETYLLQTDYAELTIDATTGTQAGLAEVRNLLFSELEPRLYQKALARYHEGKEVRFGDFDVSFQGLGYRDHLFGWDKVGPPGTKDGWVIVPIRGKRPIEVEIADVPNLGAFIDLCKQARRENVDDDPDRPIPMSS